jgi:hypothetical protein
MKLIYACGHTAEISDNPSGHPTCACGETRVQHVQVRAPRFVGACSGPCAEFKNLEAQPVNLAPGGSLTLKAAKD